MFVETGARSNEVADLPWKGIDLEKRQVTEFKVKSKFAKNWCCSDFRHSFAVHFLSKGGSLNRLQYILGHSNVHQTK